MPEKGFLIRNTEVFEEITGPPLHLVVSALTTEVLLAEIPKWAIVLAP